MNKAWTERFELIRVNGLAEVRFFLQVQHDRKNNQRPVLSILANIFDNIVILHLPLSILPDAMYY